MNSFLDKSSWLLISVVSLAFVLLSLGISISPLIAGPVQDKKTISLQNGESKVLKLDYEVKQVATGSPGVCQVVRTGLSEILINATGVGETNVILWDGDKVREEYSIIVSLRDASALAKELESLLGNIEGVQVRTVGTKVIVEGEVFSKKDLDRVNSLLENTDGVINLTKMSSLLKKLLAEEIQKSINIRGVTVRNAKESFLLEGRVESEAQKERAEKIASAYTDSIVSVISIREKREAPVIVQAPPQEVVPEPAKMLQVHLSVMEIDQDALNGMEFHWNPGTSADASGAGFASRNYPESESKSLTGAITGTISNLFPKLQKLNEMGKGRSLFEQTVVTKSGSKAHFFVGDELPIPVAQEGGVISIDYKKVGLTLDVLPTIDSLGNVDSFVDIDSSSVIGEGTGGAPKIRDTKLQSAVYVKPSESITLGGLIGQREVKSLGGSNTGDGFVFSNDTNRKELRKSQVLVFITPEILARPADAVRETRGKVKDGFKAYEYDNVNQEQIGH